MFWIDLCYHHITCPIPASTWRGSLLGRRSLRFRILTGGEAIEVKLRLLADALPQCASWAVTGGTTPHFELTRAFTWADASHEPEAADADERALTRITCTPPFPRSASQFLYHTYCQQPPASERPTRYVLSLLHPTYPCIGGTSN